MSDKNINRPLSPEDKLYERLNGKVFAKAGTAYERIATAVAGIIFNSSKTEHNVFKEGYSGVKHQLDGVIDGEVVLEAKDYSIRGANVGLEEVQKHQGAMADIDIAKRGFFASATDYTSEAKKYADATSNNPKLTDTDRAIIRPSTKEDEKNRIKAFDIDIIVPYLDWGHGQYNILFIDNAEVNRYNSYISSNTLYGKATRIFEFFDSDGKPIKSISELSMEQLPSDWNEKESIEGTLDIDACIYVGDKLFHIRGIQYKIAVRQIKESFTVEAQGNACVLVKCPSRGVDKLITDVDLKKALDKLG